MRCDVSVDSDAATSVEPSPDLASCARAAHERQHRRELPAWLFVAIMGELPFYSLFQDRALDDRGRLLR